MMNVTPNISATNSAPIHHVRLSDCYRHQIDLVGNHSELLALYQSLRAVADQLCGDLARPQFGTSDGVFNSTGVIIDRIRDDFTEMLRLIFEKACKMPVKGELGREHRAMILLDYRLLNDGADSPMVMEFAERVGRGLYEDLQDGCAHNARQ